MTGPNTAPAQTTETDQTAEFQIANIGRPLATIMTTIALAGGIAAEAMAKVDRAPRNDLLCRQIESKKPAQPESSPQDRVVRLVGQSTTGGTVVLLAAENMPQRRRCDTSKPSRSRIEAPESPLRPKSPARPQRPNRPVVPLSALAER